MNDPLAGLDGVGWADLDHAYGAADDVPDMLRALLSPDRDERREALHDLCARIYHQGNRYDASGAAIPFLLALAADPATPERVNPLYLAAGMAIGWDESHLPSGVDIDGWRREVHRLRTADPADEERRLDTWVADAADPGERASRLRRRELFDASAARRNAEAELAAYDALRDGLPVVRALTADRDAAVRAAAAYTLGWFPEDATASIPALRTVLASEKKPPETAPGVIANAVISAGLLGDRELIPLLRTHVAGDEPTLRWAAAVALLRLDATDPSVIAVLAAACAAPPDAPVAFMDGDVRRYSAACLAGMADPPDKVVPALLDGLSRTSDDESFPMAEITLRAAFGAPSVPLPVFADLTPVQQRTVRVIAGLPHDSWQWGNLHEILRAWGLPTDRDECRRYAGLA